MVAFSLSAVVISLFNMQSKLVLPGSCLHKSIEKELLKKKKDLQL